MLDPQLIGAIIFVIALSTFLYLEKKKVKLQKIFFPVLYIVLWRSSLGLKAMDKIAKSIPSFLRTFFGIGWVAGFFGMTLMSFLLIKNLLDVFTKPEAPAAVGLVLPVPIPGVVFVPFFYWILSIFFLAVVHEMSHGIVARVYNIKVKSSGFAFLGIFAPLIPLAFVEPEEKSLTKKPARHQLAVFAAGSFTNIIVAILLMLLFAFAVTPAIDGMYQNTGVKVETVNEDGPAELAGLTSGELIINIDREEVLDVPTFIQILDESSAGQVLDVTTNVSTYPVTLGEHPDFPDKGYFGVRVSQESILKTSVEQKYGGMIPIFLWFIGLFYWLLILNLGIGLFNLVPVGPIDGGRMMKVATDKIFKQPLGDKVWKWISIFFLILIVLTILVSFTGNPFGDLSALFS